MKKILKWDSENNSIYDSIKKIKYLVVINLIKEVQDVHWELQNITERN